MKKGKTKSRLMCGILYPDDNISHMKALNVILQTYNSLAICHDKDEYLFDVTDENGEIIHKKGELKKAHYHIIIKFENPRYASGVAKELDLEENLIQCCIKFKSYVIYCTHRDEPFKYQYDVSDFIGSLVPQVIKLLDKPQDRGDMLVDVLEYIKAHPSISWYQLSLWCNTYGYYETLHRNKSIEQDTKLMLDKYNLRKCDEIDYLENIIAVTRQKAFNDYMFDVIRLLDLDIDYLIQK